MQRAVRHTLQGRAGRFDIQYPVLAGDRCGQQQMQTTGTLRPFELPAAALLAIRHRNAPGQHQGGGRAVAGRQAQGVGPRKLRRLRRRGIRRRHGAASGHGLTAC